MDRSAFSKDAHAAGAQARDARRPVPHAVPSAPGKPAANPDDLVSRALAILAEGNRASDETQSADLPLQRRVLSDGTQCPLPLRYFNAQFLVATFLTDLNRAAELLNSTGLHVVPQEDGKAVAVLYCIEYRVTDLGPYKEVGLTIVATAPGDPIPANYVANLPVTTALARLVGREVWGYNKFLAAIDVQKDGKKFSTTVCDLENATICALDGSRGASVPSPPTDIFTFSLLKGRIIKTLFHVLTPFQASSGEGFVFKIGTSRHPMANNLRTLALDGARPALVQYADPFQALAFPGQSV